MSGDAITMIFDIDIRYLNYYIKRKRLQKVFSIDE